MSEPLIQVRHLKKYFPTARKGVLVKAVDDISFDVFRGETLGVVGESGCGKSTTGRLVLRLLDATAGSVLFDGIDLLALKKPQLRAIRKRMQIIFQDPYASLDPSKNVFHILSEPYRIQTPGIGREELEQHVSELVRRVGLRPEHIYRYPHEFSGGQRQRIGIARAIALHPDFIVCDEPVSALDVSIQAQIVNLMQDLKEQFSLTYLFISHDLRIIKHICDRILVMYLGNIVELGGKTEIYNSPLHPYTQALLSAIPKIRGKTGPRRIVLQGDLPSPMAPPTGCPFHPRCPSCMEICRHQKPPLIRQENGSFVACHLYKSKEKEDSNHE